MVLKILKTDANTKTTQDKLKQKLTTAWQLFVGHPNEASIGVTPMKIAEHYLSHGFFIKMGSAVAWDDESNEPEYAFSEPIKSLEALTAKLANLGIDAGQHNTQIALIHPDVTELLALIR